LDGYTALVEQMLDHPLIELSLSTTWDPTMAREYEHVVYTGPIDQFYGHRHGRLAYRTVFWEQKVVAGDHQGNAVINYPHPSDRHTRVIEHKHFAPHESHERSVVSTEYSKETGPDDIPYYPKRLVADKAILDRYLAAAREEAGVSFLGRLATYRYMDMHQVIGEAIDFAPPLGKALTTGARRPVFPDSIASFP
jgi:UDP-galactopyranose mutase